VHSFLTRLNWPHASANIVMSYQMPRPLPKDFVALAQLCRAAFAPPRAFDNAMAIKPAALHLLARRHRVQGLAYLGLRNSEADLDLHSGLAGDAMDIVRANLVAAEAAHLLTRAFDSAGITHLFVKGLALSQLVYGDPFIKMSSDIDILVDETDLHDSAQTLSQLGYRCCSPRSGNLADWHAVHKESVWSADGKPVVELHTRLADNPALLHQIHARSTRQIVPIQRGLSLPTLTSNVQLPYLAVHGASSMWFRLKWLIDYAAMSSLVSDVTDFPEVRSSLRLADRLKNQVLGDGNLCPDRALFDALLNRLALAQLTNPIEPTDRAMGTLGIHVGQILMGGTCRFAAHEAARQLQSFTVRA
jgi:hypothetical protein